MGRWYHVAAGSVDGPGSVNGSGSAVGAAASVLGTSLDSGFFP